MDSEILHIDENPLSELAEDGEAIGIITMEDVIEELLKVSDNVKQTLFKCFQGSNLLVLTFNVLVLWHLQEEIYDETDHKHENS